MKYPTIIPIQISNCTDDASGPRLLGGLISQIYTTNVLKFVPCPKPAIQRPAINIASVTELASIAAPIAKRHAPITMVLGRPMRSEIAPPKREARVVVRRTEETTRPCMVDDNAPNVAAKEDIAVTGPIVPVSRLGVCVNEMFGNGLWGEGWHTH